MENEVRANKLSFLDGTVQDSAAHAMRICIWTTPSSYHTHSITADLVNGTVSTGTLIFYNGEKFPAGMRTLVTFGIVSRSRGDNQSWSPSASASYVTNTPDSIAFNSSQSSFYLGHPYTNLAAIFIGITEPS